MRQKMRRIGFRVFLKRKRERAKDKAKPHAAAFSIYSVYLGLNQEIPPGFSCCCLPLSIASQIRGTNILSIGNGNHKIPLSLSLFLEQLALVQPESFHATTHAREMMNLIENSPFSPSCMVCLCCCCRCWWWPPGGRRALGRRRPRERERDYRVCDK